MGIEFNLSAVTQILLVTQGWEDIQPGSLEIGMLEGGFQPPMASSGMVLYGFSCISYTGAVFSGRLTALLAVKEAPPEGT